MGVFPLLLEPAGRVKIRFSDYAFKDLKGEDVMGMWRWFCTPYPPRAKPVEVPEFQVLKVEDDKVVAKYRVSNLYGKKQNLVDYFINARFTIRNGRIVGQQDSFLGISEYEFAKMAFGYPTAWLAFTPLLQWIVRKKATDKLKEFMEVQGLDQATETQVRRTGSPASRRAFVGRNNSRRWLWSAILGEIFAADGADQPFNERMRNWRIRN